MFIESGIYDCDFSCNNVNEVLQVRYNCFNKYVNNIYFILIKILYEYFKMRYNLIVIYDDVLCLIMVDVIFVFIKYQILFLKIEFEVKFEVFELFLKYDGDFFSEDEVGEFVLDKVIENYLELLYLD